MIRLLGAPQGHLVAAFIGVALGFWRDASRSTTAARKDDRALEHKRRSRSDNSGA